MMKELFSFNNGHCTKIAKELLQVLGVKITTTTLIKDLEYHPNYPSLLSLSDILNSYGIANLTIKDENFRIREYPTPFILSINHQFVIVKEVNNEGAILFDANKNKWYSLPLITLQEIWESRIAMLIDAEEAHSEHDYEKKTAAERREKIAKIAACMAFPFFAIIACIFSGSVLPVIYMLLTTAGTLVGALLILYELDKYNPLVQQICNAGKKVSCGAVLNSSASKIFGISWSAIGFAYFAGGVLALLMGGINNPSRLFMLSWINVLAIGYPFFSIYYQWRVVRQWCVLCLSVQAILVLQFITTLIAGWQAQNISITLTDITSLALTYLVPFIFALLIESAFKNRKESTFSRRRLQRLKHNPAVFNTLLEAERKIILPADELGIGIGNPAAKYKIVKVCNPYCKFCSRAHPAMEELLNNNPDVSIRIIFASSDLENDVSRPIINHLLTVAASKDETLTKQALDDWYLPAKKDYNAFMAKYPVTGNHSEKISEMNTWCKENGIDSTPTFFFNGNPLPATYTVEDLKYFLSV